MTRLNTLKPSNAQAHQRLGVLTAKYIWPLRTPGDLVLGLRTAHGPHIVCTCTGCCDLLASLFANRICSLCRIPPDG